jgi:FKBP-type peptidyl-prolyl cis-trans isomerase
LPGGIAGRPRDGKEAINDRFANLLRQSRTLPFSLETCGAGCLDFLLSFPSRDLLQPMRNTFVLVLLGVVLLTIALVVRSGMLARKNPGEPINAAMRQAMSEQSPQFSSEDAAFIRQKYPTAYPTPSGMLFIVRAPGTGTDKPKGGDEVIAHYEGRLLDGTVFDSSYKRGAPITFRVGVGQVIRGWDEALLTMKKGEKRTLIIPYWLAYGDAGRPPSIPPKATLVFDVELIDFR